MMKERIDKERNEEDAKLFFVVVFIFKKRRVCGEGVGVVRHSLSI